MNRIALGWMLLFSAAALALFTFFQLSPISQDPAYHLFKDVRTFFSIPNFWNVISNILFLLVGLLGLYKLFITHELQISKGMQTVYAVLFIGIGLVGVGSSYYHLIPGNPSLVWDRLPMTITFMALFSIVISEFISIQLGKLMLLPLLILGIASVLYWDYTEGLGRGDLRPYALIQFFPMFAIIIVLIFFSTKYTHVSSYWWLLSMYIIAKICEHLDGEIYQALHWISGHSLKHIFAGIGLYILLLSYEKRRLKRGVY